jgi:hypothetical protein
LRTKGLRQVDIDDVTVALRLLTDETPSARPAPNCSTASTSCCSNWYPAGRRSTCPTIRPAEYWPRSASATWSGAPAGGWSPNSSRSTRKIETTDKELTELVVSTGSNLRKLHGIGPSGAARLLGDVGNIHRFASRGYFASWNGTAPLDASSGDQERHRLSRAGNRRINRVLHIMAIVQRGYPIS